MTGLTFDPPSGADRYGVVLARGPGYPDGCFAAIARRRIGRDRPESRLAVWAVRYHDEPGDAQLGDLNLLHIHNSLEAAREAIAARYLEENRPRRITYASTANVYDTTKPTFTVDVQTGDTVERWEIDLERLLHEGTGHTGRILNARLKVTT